MACCSSCLPPGSPTVPPRRSCLPSALRRKGAISEKEAPRTLRLRLLDRLEVVSRPHTQNGNQSPSRDGAPSGTGLRPEAGPPATRGPEPDQRCQAAGSRPAKQGPQAATPTARMCCQAERSRVGVGRNQSNQSKVAAASRTQKREPEGAGECRGA